MLLKKSGILCQPFLTVVRSATELTRLWRLSKRQNNSDNVLVAARMHLMAAEERL
jgi:hypothetical protein